MDEKPTINTYTEMAGMIGNLQTERDTLAAQSTMRGELLFQMTEQRDDLAAQLTEAQTTITTLQADLKKLIEAFDKAAAETIAMGEALTGQLKAGEDRVMELESALTSRQIVVEDLRESRDRWQDMAEKDIQTIENLRAQVTALTSTPGQARMIDRLWAYENATDFNTDAEDSKAIAEGRILKQVFVLESGDVFAWWQRPVASTAEGSEVEK
jgi:chromosome segregation ATPase